MTRAPQSPSAADVASDNGWPQPRRHRAWGPFAVFSTSVSTAIATWCFIIGGYAAYYLPAAQGTLAVIAGSLIGILFIVLACLPVSSRYGIDGVRSTAPQFGSRGSKFSVVLIFLSTVGWNIFLFVLLGRAVVSIVAGFGVTLPDWTVGGFSILGVLLVVVLLRRGSASVKKVSQLIAVSVLVLAVAIMIMLIASAGLDALLAAPAVAPWEAPAVNWASAIEVLIASNLSWWAYTGAIVRNSPSARASLWPVVFGLGLAVGVGSLTGLYGGLLVPDSGGDPTQFLVEIGGPLFGIIALVFIVLANIGTAVIGVYAATIAARQLPGVERLGWSASTWIASVPAIVLAGFLPSVVFDNFGTFLAFLGVAFAPVCGMQIVDFLVLRRQRLDVPSLYSGAPGSDYWYVRGVNPVGFIAFALGVATYLYLLDPVSYVSRPPFEYLTASIPTVLVSAAAYWIGTVLFTRPRGLGGYAPAPVPSESEHA